MSLTSRNLFSVALFGSLSPQTTLSIAADIVRSGTYVVTSNHNTIGGASVITDGSNPAVKPGSDIRFDDAPDYKVGFGINGKYDNASQLAKLKANARLKASSGEQIHAIPDNLNISDYNEVDVWGEADRVPIGVATLN